MNNLKEKYKQHLAVLNYSNGTIAVSIFYLNRFLSYLRANDINDVTDITKETIQNYQIHLYEEINAKGQPNSVMTQNNALKVVKQFLKYLSENNYILNDPAKDITYAKTPKRLPRSILTKTETRKMLHSPDTKTTLGYRDRTILEILYSSAIRKKEITSLTIQDVDYHEGYIRINTGKGKKDRVVPIGKIACRYLENYINGIRPTLIKDKHSNDLFISIRGKKLSKNMVWEIVKKYTRKTKLKKTVSPHTFRHTCATLMLRNKANIRHIQEMLGHESLDSTQIYTHVSITDLKEVHSKCHPREKEKE